MTLDGLVAEIRARAERELADAGERAEAEKRGLLEERDRRGRELREEIGRRSEQESTRERTRTLAAARMQARKLVYEARERTLIESLHAVREQLAEFTGSEEYAGLLERMYLLAIDRLGKDARISGRAEDAARLKSIAGKGFQPTPRPIRGGLVAESADGARRLTLSFDELLRLREDRVRRLLA